MIFARYLIPFWCLSPLSSPAQDRFADCEGAIILCDKTGLVVKKLYGPGQELSEVGFTSCSGRLEERNSAWIKWQAGSAGILEFTLEPLENADDLDFIVYRLDDDIRQCSRKYEVRCMASGENTGDRGDASFACTGKTGLSRSVADTREGDGCGDDHDNFLAALDVQAGENYILYVNNYTSSGGFRLAWGGDAAITAPQELVLPAIEQTQVSKAIYFSENRGTNGLKTDWPEARLDRAFTAKAGDSRAPNVFAGCMPVKENAGKTPVTESFVIGELYPNPASVLTHAALTAPHSAVVRVEIYDVLGKLCGAREYVADRGEQVLSLPADRLDAGFYFVHFRAGKTAVTRKLMVGLR